MTHGASIGPDARRNPRKIWGREVPFRNPHFTGRETELGVLRQRLTGHASALVGQPAEPMYGLGGVGKTEIAAEYCHRHGDDYDLVWWIRAEQEETIRNALVALGSRMGLPEFHSQERDYAAGVVLDALRVGDPYERWLLVFDNAEMPDVVSRFLPQGTGHVIITSRLSEWQTSLRSKGLEISEFDPAETVAFLRRRVDRLAETDDRDENGRRVAEATRLGDTLGNLPLAAEHAAAYLVETGTRVEDYLESFDKNAHDLLGHDVDIYYPHAVATTWSVSRASLTPGAGALFQLLAFFAPEPVSEEILVRPGHAQQMPEDLRPVVEDLAELRRAARELARFSLVRIYGLRNVVQMHRVVQRVTRSRLEKENAGEAADYRTAVHTLLGASDPGSPDNEASDAFYERSFQHLIPSGSLESRDTIVRALIINQVRRMHLRGGYREGLLLAERALGVWRAEHRDDDLQALALLVEYATTLRLLGRIDESYELNRTALTGLVEGFGEENEVYLKAARNHVQGLRLLGRYQEAYEFDSGLLQLYERVFRPEHVETLNLRNNIAIDLRCLGRFEEALRYDQENLTQRLHAFGPTNTITLTSRFAVARNLRRLGRYEESLDELRALVRIAASEDKSWGTIRMLSETDLAVSLRRLGHYAEARAQGEEAYQRHLSVFGPTHRQTLQVAVNLINDRRLAEDLPAADELGRATLAGLQKVAGHEHPNTLSAAVNLAVVLRLRGNPNEARELDERALEIFERDLGPRHPSSLVAATNFASDLNATGDVRRARDLGERAMEAGTAVLGADHPATLATAANLSIDRQAVGDEEAAAALYDEVVTRYHRVLPEHPQTRLAVQRGRISLDIEPMAT
ncbi:FxSxx-COOH system tetratricopeptide repeat protein [Actinomadura sp. 9N407]|uniref:FxSxx-COOH system tetratricopeptide repeat protein n=1 Tax=Actinomadura sp. 9N407 TaxID=3375154 RepID=UPI003794883E